MPESDILTFSSTGETVLLGAVSQPDLCQVQFFLDQETEAPGLGLMMRKKLLPEGLTDEGGQLAELAPNVVAFSVDYYDGSEWLDEWIGMADLPRAVEVALTLVSPDAPDAFFSFSRIIAINAVARQSGATPAYAPEEGEEGEETMEPDYEEETDEE